MKVEFSFRSNGTFSAVPVYVESYKKKQTKDFSKENIL